MIKACQKCGGLYATENMETFGGTPCSCPQPKCDYDKLKYASTPPFRTYDISAWKNYGIEMGYWDYFATQHYQKGLKEGYKDGFEDGTDWGEDYERLQERQAGFKEGNSKANQAAERRINEAYLEGLKMAEVSIKLHGNYCPENCRWASYQIQNGNRSTSVRFRGECAVHASRRLGGSDHLVDFRIRESGWSIEEAFTKLPQQMQDKPTVRRCWICKETKPLNDFSNDKRKSQGKSYCCRLCDRVRASIQYRKHMEQPA